MPETTAAEPFDLDAWVTEATEAPFTFTWRGATYTLASAGDIDKSVLVKITSLDRPSPDDMQVLLETAMSPADWKRFQETPMPLRAVGQLFVRWQTHEGTSLGESEASAGS